MKSIPKIRENASKYKGFSFPKCQKRRHSKTKVVSIYKMLAGKTGPVQRFRSIQQAVENEQNEQVMRVMVVNC